MVNYYYYAAYNDQQSSAQLSYPEVPMVMVDNLDQYMTQQFAHPPLLPHLYNPSLPCNNGTNNNSHHPEMQIDIAKAKRLTNKRKRTAENDSPLSLSFADDVAGQKTSNSVTNKKSKNSTSASGINSLSKTKDLESVDDEEEKLHLKSLERNRLAAYKCRQRKKEWIDELAHKAERLGRENVYLRQLLLQLKEETLYLKTQLVMHKEFVQK